MQTKDDLMEAVKKEIDDTIKIVTAPKPPFDETIPLRVEPPVSTEPGTINYTEADGVKRFDGLLKETELTSVEAIAAAIEAATEEVKKEREASGRAGQGPARSSEV